MRSDRERKVEFLAIIAKFPLFLQITLLMTTCYLLTKKVKARRLSILFSTCLKFLWKANTTHAIDLKVPKATHLRKAQCTMAVSHIQDLCSWRQKNKTLPREADCYIVV